MNTATTVSHDDIRHLAHADLLMLIADLLGNPTSDLPWDQASDLFAAAPCSAPDDPCAAAWRHLHVQLQATAANERSIEHHRLFEGASACPPNQTAYVRRDKGVVIGDLCGFYRAFCLTPQVDSGEKPDHVVTQLQFLALLLVMGAAGNAGSSDEQRQIAVDAARTFADDHMAPWLRCFSEHLDRVTMLPLYHALAEVIVQTWAVVAREHGWAALASDDGSEPTIETHPPTDECGDVTDPIVPLRVVAKPAADNA